MRSKGGKLVTSSPKKRIVPEVGGKSPVMQLNSVVFPAPLEPSTARRSPGRTVSVTSVSAASAPKSRVTPRNSSAAPAPTVERRCATLSMAVVSARLRLSRPGSAAPALPKPDNAVRGEQHDDEEAETNEQPEAIAVEPDRDQKIQRERAQQDKNQGADEWTDRTGDAADDGDDENVDRPLDADRTRRDLPVVPDLQNAAERSHEGGERIGGDAVRVDVEPKRRHAARIVAHALQSQPERRAREIADRAEAERRDHEYHIIERDIRAPVDAPEMRRDDAVDAGVAVENDPILVGEVVKGRCNRQRDHDRVDALGAHRERAADGAEQRRQGERHRRRKPPGPSEADVRIPAGAEDRRHVAGKARDRQLLQADHAGIAGQEHQAQRNDAENQGRSENLDEEKAVGDERHGDQEEGDNPGGGMTEIRASQTGQGLRRGGFGLQSRVLRDRHG